MTINKDDVVMYLINNTPFIGVLKREVTPEPTDGMTYISSPEITLQYPFRITPDGKGNITLNSLFMEEEWMKFNPANVGSCIQISVLDKMKDIYIEYQLKAFSSIILPGQQSIII